MKLGERMSDELKAKISIAENCPEVKAKKSAANKRRISPNKGVPMSAEQKAKISAANTNPSPETRAKMSVVASNRTPETRAKIGAANTGELSHSWKGGRAISGRKSKAKRRTLGFVPLNEPFIGCEGHHINPIDAIYIPKQLHQSVKHNVFTGMNMDKINALAGQFLTEDWT
jgi:hypothetical protein